jgi:hypothetical protein
MRRIGRGFILCIYSVLAAMLSDACIKHITVQLGARNMAGSDWTVGPNQTMLCDDVSRPQYHKARLGTHSSGGAHRFIVASAARAVTADSLRRQQAYPDR